VAVNHFTVQYLLLEASSEGGSFFVCN